MPQRTSIERAIRCPELAIAWLVGSLMLVNACAPSDNGQPDAPTTSEVPSAPAQTSAAGTPVPQGGGPSPRAGTLIDPLSKPLYLLFQNFTGANNGTGVFHQMPPDQSALKANLLDYVKCIQDKLDAETLPLATDRHYGYSIGPLTLDQSDQELSDTIKTSFDVAIERHVALALHFDITHFWKNAKNADGTLLSDARGADDNREWKDWNGTIAEKDAWDGEPGIMPSMSFESEQVKALVDRVAGTVIAPAVKAGMARLESSGDASLFAGVILGWEAGSLNPPGYHSLKLKGYSSANSQAELTRAQQQILHDYLRRWAKRLVTGGLPRSKIYTHTSSMSQPDIDKLAPTLKQKLGESGFEQFIFDRIGNGPDSFWDSFNDDSNAGFSIYVNSAGVFEAIYAEAARHSGSWGEAEGTNVKIDGTPSEITWETYLGRIYNHGGTLANLFGGFLGSGSGGYGKSTESAEAVAAYQRFLTGKTLRESTPAEESDSPSAAASTSPVNPAQTAETR